MNKAKILYKGAWCLVCILLFCAGLFMVGTTKNEEQAKADDNYIINYYGISTSSQVFSAYDDDYKKLILDKNTNKVSVINSDGTAYPNQQNQIIANCFPGIDITPTADSNGTTSVPAVFSGELIPLNSTFVNGKIVDNSNNGESNPGWFYESDYGEQITLTSLVATFGINALPADFVTGNYSPTTNAETKEINLYCIINPSQITLRSGALGNFGFEGEPSSETKISNSPAQIMYSDVKEDFLVPTPDNSSLWRFDGYFTEEIGGMRVTDRYGNMRNGDMATTGWIYNISSIYAHYVQVFNVTYYYTLNNKTYHGATQFDTSKTINERTLNETVYADTAYSSTNAPLTFPTDKVVANWYTDPELTQLASFPLSQVDTTLYARLANSTYNIIFNANGGEFTNDRGTTIPYTLEYGKTLSDAILRLTTELGSNVPVATRTGYECNNRNWAISPESTTPLSRTTQFMTQDREVYLIWTVKTYRIEYHTDGTVSRTTENANYNQDLWNTVSRLTPTRTGYNFICWAYSTNTDATSYTLTSRPTSKTMDFNTTTTLTFIRDEADEADRELMPDGNINLYGVWIQAYTIKFALNQGEIYNINETPLVLGSDKRSIAITIENGETLGEALARQDIADFFTNTKYQPQLNSCFFQGWYYYKDRDYANTKDNNITPIDESLLSMKVTDLQDRNIDITKDGVIAAKYNYNKDTVTYTTPPEDSINTFFAVILMVISIILLVMLIVTHRGSSRIEINDKAIDAYREIYGEDAPLPTFESTKPPFDVDESSTKDDNKD